jgi:hypothetical protein
MMSTNDDAFSDAQRYREHSERVRSVEVYLYEHALTMAMMFEGRERRNYWYLTERTDLLSRLAPVG